MFDVEYFKNEGYLSGIEAELMFLWVAFEYVGKNRFLEVLDSKWQKQSNGRNSIQRLRYTRLSAGQRSKENGQDGGSG